MPNKYLDSVGLAEYTTLIKTALDDKADLASPALTGTPTAPTPTAGDDSTKIATTEFVQDEVANYLPLTGGSVTGNLTVSGTITGNVTGTASGNLPLSGGTMTGVLSFDTGSEARIQNSATNNDTNVGIYGGQGYANGAYLILNGKNKSQNGGAFGLYAKDDNGTKSLFGKPDGTLQWNGSNVITAAGGTMTGELKLASGSNTRLFIAYETNNNFSLGVVGSGADRGAGLLSKQGSFSDSLLILKGGTNSTNPSFQLTAGDGTTAKSLVGKPDGTLTWYGLDISPQAFSYSGTSSDVSVPNNTVKNLFSLTLTKGTWLVIVNASFANHSTGYRTLGIATSTTSQNMDRNTIVRAGAANGANTNLSLSCMLAVSSSTTYYVNVVQTSGSSLNVSGGSMRFRLSAKA